VLDAVTGLGYRRNGPARSLRTRAAMVLGVIISDITNPFFTAVVRGAEDQAQLAGYSVVLANAVGLEAASIGTQSVSAPLGCPPTSGVVVLTNRGNQPSVLGPPIVSPGVMLTRSDTCAVLKQLDPGASCALGATFSPTMIGPQTATLTLPGSPGGAAVLAVPMTGLAPVTVTPASLDLSATDASAPPSLTLMIGPMPQTTLKAMLGPNPMKVFNDVDIVCPPAPVCGTCTITPTFTMPHPDGTTTFSTSPLHGTFSTTLTIMADPGPSPPDVILTVTF